MQTDKAENALLACMTFALDMTECVIVFYNMCWTMGCPKWVVFRCPSVSRCDYLWWKHSWEWEKSVSKILTLSKVSSLAHPSPVPRIDFSLWSTLRSFYCPPPARLTSLWKELTLAPLQNWPFIQATHQTGRPDKISTCLDHVLTCPDKKLENN